MADLAAEVERLERDGWSALCGPDGAAFYDEVMAEDGLMVFPGMVMNKDAALAAIAAAAPWTSFELSEIRVVGDESVALIAYRAMAQRRDAAPYEAQMSSVYARRAGRWLLLLHQQSPG